MQAERVRLPGDGLRLAGDAYGDREAPPVLFFHGGGQSRRAWAGSARRVAQAGYYGVTLDLRGHGESGWAADGDYFVDAYARDIEALLAHLRGAAAIVGASRGGQAALIAGSRAPAGSLGLVMLADAGPFMHDEGVAGVRDFFRASDQGFASAEEAAEALHIHLGQPRMPDASRLHRSLRSEAGRLFWHWDPRATDPRFLHPPAEGEALIAAAERIACPLVLVKAGRSNILSDESVAQFRALTPQLEVEVAAGAGHMFTADRNDAFAETLLRYLARHAAIAP